MKISKLTNPERANGFSHVIDFDHTDIAVAAGTGYLELMPLAVGHLVRNVGYQLLEAFSGGATSGLTVQIGQHLASGSDDDGLLTAKQLHQTDTEVFFGTGDGAALNQAGGLVVNSAGTLEALFTASGANLNVLTQGRGQVFVDLVDLGRIAREYVPE